MLKDDRAPVSAFSAGEDDPPFARGFHGGTSWSRVVDTTVRTHLVEDRVAAAEAEARADSGEVDRRTQKRFTHASPIGREVFGLSLGIDVANGTDTTTSVGELGGNDRPFTDLFPVFELLLEHQSKSITGSNVERKVHVPAEDFGHLHDEIVGQSSSLPRLEKRAIDDTSSGGDRDIRQFDNLFERESVTVPGDMERPDSVRSVDESCQARLRVNVEFDLLSRSDSGEFLREWFRTGHQRKVTLWKSEPLEDEIERVSRIDSNSMSRRASG